MSQNLENLWEKLSEKYNFLFQSFSRGIFDPAEVKVENIEFNNNGNIVSYDLEFEVDSLKALEYSPIGIYKLSLDVKKELEKFIKTYAVDPVTYKFVSPEKINYLINFDDFMFFETNIIADQKHFFRLWTTVYYYER